MSEPQRSVLDELRMRLVRKEISADEYDEMCKRISPVPTWLPLKLQEWLPLIGAFMFGAVLGWTAQHVVVSTEASITLLVSLVGTLGGGAVTALFPARGMLFGAYCIGLAVSFFLCAAIVTHPFEREPKPAEQAGI